MSAQINNPAEFLLFPSGRIHWCTCVQHEALSGNIIRVMIMNNKIFMLCGQRTHTQSWTHNTLSNIEKYWRGVTTRVMPYLWLNKMRLNSCILVLRSGFPECLETVPVVQETAGVVIQPCKCKVNQTYKHPTSRMELGDLENSVAAAGTNVKGVNLKGNPVWGFSQ